MAMKKFTLPVELLMRRLENAEFPHSVVLHKEWNLCVSEKPLIKAEALSFSAARLVPEEGILLTAETSGKIVSKEGLVSDITPSDSLIEKIRNQLENFRNLIRVAGVKAENLKRAFGLYTASKGPILWLSYEQVTPPTLQDSFHTHVTKGKPPQAITPSERDILNVWKSLKPNQETLLFVFPHDEMDKSILEAGGGELKTEEELLKKAVSISLKKRLNKEVPFFVVKIKKTTDNKLEIHVPSEIVLSGVKE